MYVCLCELRCPWRQERVSDPLRLKLTDGCESPDESQELNADSLKEHQVLSTTELSLHLISIFK